MQPLTRDELDRLERLAGKARPGPWAAFHPYADEPDVYAVQKLEGRQPRLDRYEPVCEGVEGPNARFIAAANPETILRLVAMARRGRETT